MRRAVIHADGASAGNPGPSGIGAVIEFEGKTHNVCKFIGSATNNVAEYTALVEGLRCARALGADRVELYMDSELVVRQIMGRYQVRKPHLKPLYQEAMRLLGHFETYSIEHVRREFNTEADRLSKAALKEPSAQVT